MQSTMNIATPSQSYRSNEESVPGKPICASVPGSGAPMVAAMGVSTSHSWDPARHDGGEPLQQVPLMVAAKLVGVLADERSAREACPVVPAVISGGGAGDQTVESLEVKVPVGKVKTESAPTGGRTSRQVVARANRCEASKYLSPTRIGGWGGCGNCRDRPLGSWSTSSS